MASGQSTVSLPFEITTEILSRLPVKSLLRFKSICKNWYALIKTHDFIAKHLLTYSTSLLLTKYNHQTQKYSLSLVNNDGFSHDPIDLAFPFINWTNHLHVGIKSRGNTLSIQGICNGLACISLSPVGYPLVLCNPSTREFREIANSEWNWVGENDVNRRMYVKRETFGFGFDPSADDYKLIRIVSYVTTSIEGDISIEDHIRADLYAMSADTWTEIDANKLSLVVGEKNDFGVYDDVHIVGCSASAVLNGVFYWPAGALPTNQVVVVSFDMGDEVFGKIRTPECLNLIWKKANWKVTQLNDKLALVVVSADERALDVWVLDENEISWTNQVKLGFQVKLRSSPLVGTFMGNGEDAENIVVGDWKDGELLMAEHKVSSDLKLFSYDTKTRETKDLFFGRVPNESYFYLCAETLLPVTQANEVVLNQKNKNRKH